MKKFKHVVLKERLRTTSPNIAYPISAGRKGALGKIVENDTGRADMRLRRFSWEEK